MTSANAPTSPGSPSTRAKLQLSRSAAVASLRIVYFATLFVSPFWRARRSPVEYHLPYVAWPCE